MKVMLFAFLLIGAVTVASAETPTHCSNAEKIIFSCQIRNSKKVLSLCASNDLSDKSGYLQYRFGRLNSIELEFPKERNKSQNKFLYRHYFRYQVDRTEIGFENNGHEYTIYSYYEGDGQEKPTHEEGVQVDNIEFLCNETLSADFTPLEDAVPCDTESALGC